MLSKTTLPMRTPRHCPRASRIETGGQVRGHTSSRAIARSLRPTCGAIPVARDTNTAVVSLSICTFLVSRLFTFTDLGIGRWEHDPAWAVTSKLLISKHQQVQLLEAASVLCNMTTENLAANHSDFESAAIDPSEDSSASPGFSSSEMQDELSSVETTPPPMSEAAYPVPDTKRYSSSSNGFSRSYRSMPSSSYAESVHSPGLPPHRLSGVDFRPSTSGTDDGTLAAATAGLTFGSGTPRTKPTYLGADVPPVPPLPQQYQSFNSKSSDSTLTTVYNPLLQMHPPTLTQNISDERNYRHGHDDRDIHMDDEEMFRMD